MENELGKVGMDATCTAGSPEAGLGGLQAGGVVMAEEPVRSLGCRLILDSGANSPRFGIGGGV